MYFDWSQQSLAWEYSHLLSLPNQRMFARRERMLGWERWGGCIHRLQPVGNHRQDWQKVSCLLEDLTLLNSSIFVPSRGLPINPIYSTTVVSSLPWLFWKNNYRKKKTNFVVYGWIIELMYIVALRGFSVSLMPLNLFKILLAVNAFPNNSHEKKEWIAL